MSFEWFKQYAEWADDPKVQIMSEAMQRRHMMLLCDRARDILVTLRDEEIAFRWRISLQELLETKKLFMDKGFIDANWSVLNWEKRQAADTHADRQRRYRDRKRSPSVTEGVTSVTQERDAKVTIRGEEIREEEKEQPPLPPTGREPVSPAPAFDPEPQTDPEPEDSLPITPAMLARKVLVDLGIAGRYLAVNLEQVAAAELKAGNALDVVTRRMITAWHDYARAGPELRYTVGAEKFFGEGLWRDSATWPWKEIKQLGEAQHERFRTKTERTVDAANQLIADIEAGRFVDQAFDPAPGKLGPPGPRRLCG